MSITSSTNIARLARPSTADVDYEGSVSMVAGQLFKIETSPAGAELLAVTVPVGEAWTLLVRVDILKVAA